MVAAALDSIQPRAVHIATEGPIGWAARALCLQRAIAFTTSYHTAFPQYLRARAPIPEALSYAVLRRFHNSGYGVMTATESLRQELAARGFRHLLHWSRGVDLDLFHPALRARPEANPPRFLYVGRIAVEKNIEAFLSLDLPGEKHVVGDGPDLPRLKSLFPKVFFYGALAGQELACAFANADVFVFPSRTDTFGLVLLEAMASGTPVAAYPCAGPIDVVRSAKVGALDNDLRAAALRALSLDRRDCRAYAQAYSWQASAQQFAANVQSGIDRHQRRQNALQDFRRRTA
jgi:hypothetical protein